MTDEAPDNAGEAAAIPADRAGIERLVLDFITRELLDENTDLSPDDDLLSGELLDSMGVLRLATHVDETFAIGMKPADFRVENFRSARALADYVLSTRA